MQNLFLLKKSNIKNDILLLDKVINTRRKIDVEKNNITGFKSGDYIYTCTNEKLKLYYDKNLEDKKVLSVTSSGDHILHAALAGAKKIVGFDINRFCKYYSALKIAMIKKYTFYEFTQKYREMIELFTSYDYGYLKEKNAKRFLNVLDEVSLFLSKDEKLFWDNVKKYLESNNYSICLFYHGDSKLEDLNAWFDKINYQELKNNLINICDVSYVDSNIINLKQNVNDTFDVMYISNILERIKDVDSKNMNKKSIKILTSLNKLLNDNGKIYDYYFNNKYQLKSIDIEKNYDTNVIQFDNENFVVSVLTKKSKH